MGAKRKKIQERIYVGIVGLRAAPWVRGMVRYIRLMYYTRIQHACFVQNILYCVYRARAIPVHKIYSILLIYWDA